MTGSRDRNKFTQMHRTTPPVERKPLETTLYDLVVTPREAFLFLFMSAQDYDSTPCDIPNCEVCYEFCYSWHGLYQALPAGFRLDLEEALSAMECPTPRFPKGF